MIGTIDVTVQAARPDLPLPPVRAFVGSPSSVRIRNVPRRIGEWEITRVFVTANYPDSTTETAECVLTGGVWVGTVLGCATPGTSLSGFVVNADGIDEFGQPVVGYILGIGDVEVLTRERSVTPGVITFKGDKGDKGDPGEKGEKGDPGEGAVNSVNGKVGDVVLDAHDVGAYTKEETDDKITRFDQSLAAVAKSGEYNDLTGVPSIPQTAEDIGALPDTTFVPSTAADVGALPVGTTAADIGALAADGTAADANKLGGMDASDYALKKSGDNFECESIYTGMGGIMSSGEIESNNGMHKLSDKLDADGTAADSAKLGGKTYSDIMDDVAAMFDNGETEAF